MDVIVLPSPGMEMPPAPQMATMKMNADIVPTAAPKMKAKKATRVKAAPKPKRAEKIKTPKPKAPKPAAEGGKVKTKHAHAHHPPWADMMMTAVKALNERHGSSVPAIKKYILSTYKIDTEPDKITPMLRRGLKAAMASNKLKQVKGKGLAGSFKMVSHANVNVDKKIKKGKLVKKASKSAGKKIIKKEKKPDKKQATGKKTKPKKTKMAPTDTTSLLASATLAAAPLLQPELGKMKKPKKPKAVSKKSPKIKKAPMKAKSAKSPKARKAPKPKAAMKAGIPTLATVGIAVPATN